MKRIAFFIAFASVSVTGAAQEAATAVTDTVQHDLQEVVVEAPKVIRKFDMDVYYPSSSAVEYSKNGLQLLRNLMIPTLSVNEFLKTVKTSGESVQMRINDRVATIDQVNNLRPETVKRVEWIDDPGLRYGGTVAVINFIVVNPTVGGSLFTDVMQALNDPYGVYKTSLNLNNGRSQWGVFAQYKMTNRIGAHRDYTETFTFADGESLTRTESPRSGGYASDNHYSYELSYSYVKPDTTAIWVSVDGYGQLNNDKLYNGTMSQSNGAHDLLLRDFTGNNAFQPSASAYFEQHFAHNQILAIDLQADLLSGTSKRSYTENDGLTSALLNEVNTNIKDRNKSYAAASNYIKKWNNSRFTAGISYTANRNRSTYEHLNGEVYHQRQDKTYFFGEYFHRINKVSLSVGMGAQYTDIKFRETQQGSNSWNVRPRFTATYRHSTESMFLFSFTSWQNTPSLSQTNITPSQTDGIQWQVGNPNLKTSSSYQIMMRYKYTLKRMSGSFMVQGVTTPKDIATYLYWDDDKLFTSYENSKGRKQLALSWSPQIEMVPKWVTLSGTLLYILEESEGKGYKHVNRDWSGNVELQAQHWGFSLSLQYEKSPHRLTGESYHWGESVSSVLLGYRYKNWQFGAGAICPFTKYDQGSELVNRYNSNEYHMRLNMSPMYIVRASYNIHWGHQKQGVNKIVDAEAKAESSSVGGR